MIEVTVHSGEESPEIFSYQKSSVMIGRSSGNDICLDIDGISRYHARIYVEGENVLLQDLDSTNGTFLNSQPVKGNVAVKEDDKVTIGNIVLTVLYREDEPDDIWTLDSTVVEADENTTGTDTFVSTESDMPQSPELAVEADTEDVSGADVSGSFYWQALRNFLAPVWSYIEDENVSEIMINGPEEIYIESKGKLSRSDSVFTGEQLKAAVLNIAQYVGRRVSEQEPYLDARLPDGSRVAVLLPPCARKGISIAIRKFAKETLTVDRLIDFGSFSDDMRTFLQACVILKKNLIISGGTSSGKTSLLNAVSGMIPEDERIITIEDSAELQLIQEHVVPMETKPPDKKGRGQVTIRDLVKASLRMRPDRVVVGEIRGGEALDLLQAMNTGHSGSMATLHASSPEQALTRLETLSLFSGLEIPIRALREQVSTAIDIVIQATRLPDHSRKVTYISEVGSLNSDGTYSTNDIFRFVRTGSVDGKIEGNHQWTGNKPSIIEELELAGLTEALALFKKGK